MSPPGASVLTDRPTPASRPSAARHGRPPVRRARRFRLDSPLVVIGLLWLVLLVPLLVALGVLTDPPWYPIGDLAQTELRVRDVFSTNVPLIGLAGRFGDLGSQGSHPGPLSFWVLAPFYRLFGGGSAALLAAAVATQFLAVGGSLAVAYRRGGVRLTLGVAAVLAVLLHAYGTPTLTEPWNPYMPVMWWFLFLLAVWSVVADDLAMLPVAVFAGSFCLQTHISYLGLIGGLVVLLGVVVARAAYRGRGDRAARRSLLRWSGIAVALGVVLWAPPVIEYFTSEPGNFTVISETFTDPPEEPIGLGRGAELWLMQLNPWQLLTGAEGQTGYDLDSWPVGGSILPGLAFLGVWLATVVVAWRLRHRALLRLDLVVAAALALGLMSLAQIHGATWPYLMLWTLGITALTLVAVVWTAGVLVNRRLASPVRPRMARLASLALVAITLVWSGIFVFDASHAEVPSPRLSQAVGLLADPTEAALVDGSVPGGGADGEYWVTWSDPVSIGSQGVALLLELERRGFDVGVPPSFAEGVHRHRGRELSEITGEIHLSVGPDIEVWRAKPEAVEVAYLDMRTPAERSEFEQLRLEVISELRDAGLEDLVPDVDTGLLPLAVGPDTPASASEQLAQMMEIGLPVAVFVAPPLPQVVLPTP